VLWLSGRGGSEKANARTVLRATEGTQHLLATEQNKQVAWHDAIGTGAVVGREWARSQPGHRVRRGAIDLKRYAEPREVSSGGLLLPVTGTEEPRERGVLRDGERAEP